MTPIRFYVKSIGRDYDHGGSMNIQLDTFKPDDPESILEGSVFLTVGSWEELPFDPQQDYLVSFTPVAKRLAE